MINSSRLAKVTARRAGANEQATGLPIIVADELLCLNRQAQQAHMLFAASNDVPA